MPSMRVNYELKFRDYALFNGIHQFLSTPVQIFYIALSAFIGLTSGGGLAGRLLVVAIVYCAMWAAQQVFNLVYLRVGRYRALLTEHTVEIQDDGFHGETRFSRSVYLWPGINRVVQRWGFIAVYIHAQGAFIVPNRAFESEHQRKQFFLALKEKPGTSGM